MASILLIFPWEFLVQIGQTGAATNLTSCQNRDKNDEEDVKNKEEVKDDAINNDDVCDFKAKDVGSSYNPHDVNKPDRIKTFWDGGVDEEPGGNVSARSRSLRFRPFNA